MDYPLPSPFYHPPHPSRNLQAANVIPLRNLIWKQSTADSHSFLLPLSRPHVLIKHQLCYHYRDDFASSDAVVYLSHPLFSPSPASPLPIWLPYTPLPFPSTYLIPLSPHPRRPHVFALFLYPLFLCSPFPLPSLRQSCYPSFPSLVYSSRRSYLVLFLSMLFPYLLTEKSGGRGNEEDALVDRPIG